MSFQVQPSCLSVDIEVFGQFVDEHALGPEPDKLVHLTFGQSSGRGVGDPMGWVREVAGWSFWRGSESCAVRSTSFAGAHNVGHAKPLPIVNVPYIAEASSGSPSWPHGSRLYAELIRRRRGADQSVQRRPVSVLDGFSAPRGWQESASSIRCVTHHGRYQRVRPGQVLRQELPMSPPGPIGPGTAIGDCLGTDWTRRSLPALSSTDHGRYDFS